MRSAQYFTEKTKPCSCLHFRSIMILVVGLSVIHILNGAVSICLGTISSIQGIVWMAHRLSPIWSGTFVRFYPFSFIESEFILLVHCDGCIGTPVSQISNIIYSKFSHFYFLI